MTDETVFSLLLSLQATLPELQAAASGNSLQIEQLRTTLLPILTAMLSQLSDVQLAVLHLQDQIGSAARGGP